MEHIRSLNMDLIAKKTISWGGGRENCQNGRDFRLEWQ
jgi:hypothetical protein